MLDYKMSDLKSVYEVFDKAFKLDSESFSNPKHLYNYFKTLHITDIKKMIVKFLWSY